MKQSSIKWQYVLPQRLLSRFLGSLANCRIAWFKNRLISYFIRYFKVDLQEAVTQDYRQFPDFNSFFTRPLQHDARPIGQGLVSPVDGIVSAVGTIAQEQIFQAKNHDYSLSALLANAPLVKHFINGDFLTAYLAPRDYHRIHMPLSGRLLSMRYLPGRLFSVNENTTAQVDGLFARNERVVCHFESEQGDFVLVAVGAMVVASIVMNWHGVVNGEKKPQLRYWDYRGQSIYFNKGDEIGHFKLGSTVILLFQAGRFIWHCDLTSKSRLQMGQSVAIAKL